jgi:hypothetical protein
MTSQSPRIYIYKITFDEVLYYYYGVHKEKKFGEYYMGSPKTHKWCWELYSPKKQILELFDYTDEGWIEAQKVETRLIRPFYNTGKWCLNESCGGLISIEQAKRSGKKGGKRTKELGIGLFGMTEVEKEISQKKGRSISGLKHKENGTGVFGRSKEKMTEDGKKGGKISGNITKLLGVGIHSLTKEQKSEAGKKSNKQKWKCLETGYVSTAAGVVMFQKARCLDTSKNNRERVV